MPLHLRNPTCILQAPTPSAPPALVSLRKAASASASPGCGSRARDSSRASAPRSPTGSKNAGGALLHRPGEPAGGRRNRRGGQQAAGVGVRDLAVAKKDYYRDPLGRIDVAALQATFAVQKDLGFLKTTIDARRFVDLSVIEEAGRRPR